MRFDHLNHLSVDHDYVRQTDGRIDRTAVSNSVVKFSFNLKNLSPITKL